MVEYTSPHTARAQYQQPARGVYQQSAARFPHRKSYAALDLGTNNCRLLIARPDGQNFTIVDAFSRIVRLGEGLTRTGALSQKAMDRAVAALSICADKMVRRNVTLAHSVATEACRRAKNGEEFVARVYAETGIKLDIIPAKEEARLALLGCQNLLPKGDGPALVFDIGGGSTELVLVNEQDGKPQMVDWVSIPWGVVSLSEAVPHDCSYAKTRADAYSKMCALVEESLDEFTTRLPEKGASTFRLLGTSGTVTTLGSVYLQLPHYDRYLVDGLITPVTDMRDICTMLANKSVKERSLLPCIGTERADLVVAGCAILEVIFNIWGAEHVSIADRGIREGILRRLIASGERK